MENYRSKRRRRGVKLNPPGRPFLMILRRLKHRGSNNKRYQEMQFDRSDSSSVSSSSSSHGANSSTGKKTVSNHRLQRGKKRWFIFHNGFLRFLFRSKFKFVPSSSGGKKIIGKKIKEMNDEFIIDSQPRPFRLPQRISKKLYPHQIEGLKWLMSLYCKGRGGILADNVGLEETDEQICCFIAGLFYSNLANSVLVVCHSRHIPMWEKELSHVELHSHCKKMGSEVRADGGSLDLKHVHLASYELMAKSTPTDFGEYELGLDYIFLDEGHCIKNPATEISKKLLRLQCRNRIIITATPLQNNLLELWTLFQFCAPGLLGCKKDFINNYGCINSVVEKSTSIHEQNLGYLAAQTLRKSIRPYFMRRTKSDYGISLPLPKKNEMVIWLKLTPIQRQLYKDFLMNIESSSENYLAALSILKKICNHPQLTKGVAKDDVNLTRDASCKISFISLLLDFLKKQGIVFARLDGKIKDHQRLKIFKDFEEGNGPVLLLTSGMGGSERLTKADRVILVDPSWNPCIDVQCIDRAYHTGQTKDVIVYRLVTCGTIEEKIYMMQVLKEGLFRCITEDKEQPRYFDREDSKDMYSLPKDEAFDSSQAALQLPQQQDYRDTMEDSFQRHLEFLKTLDIAGVTHHSMLF